ncbi:hypothetical protein H4R26_005241 [Coemansia thaxteri]|uniref:Uncharacterized protein n=1 Tax=Coemansia thaxteri TaxID=2663907 RepID=A0A9W8BB36_9FUNG|nr:hypothetical protein H4R26_005241 [Coemansia thaxteri]KAJ2476111.1 hypothetical protein EV174_005041 [Coemansia sp. RSA 2320]
MSSHDEPGSAEPKTELDDNQVSDSPACTITVRIIRNFEHRTSKNLILQVVTAQTTVGELKEICRKHIAEDPRFKIFRRIEFDALKLYTQAHGTKTQNLIINLGEDGFLNNDSALLDSVGVINETELSLFNDLAYKAYADDPHTKW